MPTRKRTKKTTEPAIQTVSDDISHLYHKAFEKMPDPDFLERWLDARGVHAEVYVYTGDEPWQEILDAGAELHASALRSDRKLFRTEGESDSLVFFLAKSAGQIEDLLKKFHETEVVVADVMQA